MANDFIIRSYQPGDRQAVREICFRTGFMGEPADFYWRDFQSFADIWTSYYTDQEPGSVFVVERSGTILGYLLGCVDTSKAPSPETLILQQMRRRWLLFRPGTAGFFWRSIWDMLRDRKRVEGELRDPRYPAHLHIDLLAEARGLGAGAALMHTWFERLKVAGSPGCHLSTLAENTWAIEFFERVGFRRFGTPTLIPGMRTPDGKRLHQQVMVREVSTST